jgi:hypothetical protein
MDISQIEVYPQLDILPKPSIFPVSYDKGTSIEEVIFNPMTPFQKGNPRVLLELERAFYA